MIAGEVRIPAFSMKNEPLIRKHVFSAILAVLRAEPEAKMRTFLSSASGMLASSV